MTGTALQTNEILQYLVMDKIVITFTAQKMLISTCISIINIRICDVLLNFFVSVYVDEHTVMPLIHVHNHGMECKVTMTADIYETNNDTCTFWYFRKNMYEANQNYRWMFETKKVRKRDKSRFEWSPHYNKCKSKMRQDQVSR